MKKYYFSELKDAVRLYKAVRRFTYIEKPVWVPAKKSWLVIY